MRQAKIGRWCVAALGLIVLGLAWSIQANTPASTEGQQAVADQVTREANAMEVIASKLAGAVVGVDPNLRAAAISTLSGDGNCPWAIPAVIEFAEPNAAGGINFAVPFNLRIIRVDGLQYSGAVDPNGSSVRVYANAASDANFAVTNAITLAAAAGSLLTPTSLSPTLRDVAAGGTIRVETVAGAASASACRVYVWVVRR